MDIALGLDKNYIMQCGVVIYSICVNNRESDISFHVVCDFDMSETSFQKLKESLLDTNKRLFVYRIDSKIFASYPNLNNTIDRYDMTAATYFRLFLSGGGNFT